MWLVDLTIIPYAFKMVFDLDSCRTLHGPKRRSVRCFAAGNIILEVKNLHAKVVGQDRSILQGVDLVVREGEVRQG